MLPCDKENFPELLDGLANTMNYKLDPDSVRFYWNSLSRYSIETVKRAVDVWAENNTRFPKPVELATLIKGWEPAKEGNVNPALQKKLAELDKIYVDALKEVNGSNGAEVYQKLEGLRNQMGYIQMMIIRQQKGLPPNLDNRKNGMEYA